MILNPLWLWNTLYLHHTFSLSNKIHTCYLLNTSQGFFCWYVFLISTCMLCWILTVSTQYYSQLSWAPPVSPVAGNQKITFPRSCASRMLVFIPPIRDIPARFGRWGRNRSHYCAAGIGRQVSFLGRCSQEVLQWLPYTHPLWIILINASSTSVLRAAQTIGGGFGFGGLFFYN